jgi:formate dehydrogenase maturation protein FdhE
MGHRCRACGSSEVVTITLKVDSQDLSFTACHACEEKWWDKDGEQVELRSVINLVSPK